MLLKMVPVTKSVHPQFGTVPCSLHLQHIWQARSVLRQNRNDLLVGTLIRPLEWAGYLGIRDLFLQ